MILHKSPRRLASARAVCLLDGGGFDGYLAEQKIATIVF